MDIFKFFKKKPAATVTLKNTNIVKMYIPPLSALLTRAEQLKGGNLTKEEVERIATDAERIDIPRDVAIKTSGYESVTPGTAWEYWQKRKSELANPKPRHVICILGNWENFDVIESILKERLIPFTLDRDYSILSPNPKMKQSFLVNQDKLPSTLTSQDWKAVEEHSAVAYILSEPLETHNAEAISGEALLLIQRLFNHGAIAAQSESAGLTHGKAKWIKLAEKYRDAHENGTEFDVGIVLYQAWVQRGIVEHNHISYTLGMHLLGQRDIEYLQSEEPLEAEIEWIDLLGYYIMGDKPERPILKGEGFRLSADSDERRIISLVDCDRYSKDNYQYNPYGYYRLNLTS